MKKIICLLLVTALVLTIAPMAVLAADRPEVVAEEQGKFATTEEPSLAPEQEAESANDVPGIWMGELEEEPLPEKNAEPVENAGAKEEHGMESSIAHSETEPAEPSGGKAEQAVLSATDTMPYIPTIRQSDSGDLTAEPKITSFTGQDLVDADLIEDANFANAIADSIMKDQNNFYNGKSLGDFTTLEEVLNNFTGVINASGTDKADNEKIKSIVGFHHLRKANTVDISDNLIEDLRPMAAPDELDLYYGNTTDPYKNMKINIAGNPILHLPTYLGGLLTLLGGDTHKVIFSMKTFQYISNGQEDSFSANTELIHTYDGVLATLNEKVGATNFADGKDVNSNKAAETGADRELKITKGENSYQLTVQNIQATGQGQIVTGAKEKMEYESANADTSYTTASRSIQYIIPIATEIYNKIEVNNDFKTAHTILFTKTSAQDDKLLAGAVYELYQEGSDTPIGEYTTGPDGTFTVAADDLSDGRFYFLEKQAPAGYELNPEKVYVDLQAASGGKVEVKTNSGNTITPNDGTGAQDPVTVDGAFALGGVDQEGNTNDTVDLVVTIPAGGSLESITVTRTAGRSGADTAPKVFTGTNAETEAEEYIQKAVQDYANVEVTAEFSMPAVSVGQSDRPAEDEPDESKPNTPTTPTQPTIPTQPGTPTTPGQQNGSGIGMNENTVNAPKTGDNANIELYLTLLIVAGAAITGFVIYQRRKGGKKV